MSNDPNEDLIEATMRRVAQARAGHADGEARHIAEDAARGAGVESPKTASPAEDAIEATIRRVAEAQAARAGAASANGTTAAREGSSAAIEASQNSTIGDVAEAARQRDALIRIDRGVAQEVRESKDARVDEDEIEATIRRVAEAQAARAGAPNADHAASAAAGPASEDNASAIHEVHAAETEATTRHIAAAQAVRAGDSGAETTATGSAPAGDRADDDEIEATIRRVAAAQAARAGEPRSEIAETFAEIRSDEDATNQDVVTEVERVGVGASPNDLTESGNPDGSRNERAETETDSKVLATTDHVADDGNLGTSDAFPRQAAELRADDDADGDAAIAGISLDSDDSLDAGAAEAPIDILAINGRTQDQADIDALAQRAIAARARAEADAVAAEAARIAEGERRQAEIDATIRRVAQAQAAREREAAMQADARATDKSDAVAYDSLASRGDAPATNRVDDGRASLDENGRWQEAVARLEASLEETRRELQALGERFDAFANPDDRSRSTPHLEAVRVTHRDDDDDDDGDWAVTNQGTGQFGAPPRPALLREPSPMTASARQLQPEVADSEQHEDEAIVPTPVVASATNDSGMPSTGALRRGLDLLPRTYRVTVEDKRRGVDLVPLHRALRGLDGMRDMSLLSYSNGVAMVALETVGPVAPEDLADAVSRAMSREAKVEVHNEQTMVVKLAAD